MMSKKNQLKKGGVKATLLSVAIILISMLPEVIRSGAMVEAAILGGTVILCLGGHEILQQEQFAFPEEVEDAIPRPEAIADYIQDSAESGAERLEERE